MLYPILFDKSAMIVFVFCLYETALLAILCARRSRRGPTATRRLEVAGAGAALLLAFVASYAAYVNAFPPPTCSNIELFGDGFRYCPDPPYLLRLFHFFSLWIFFKLAMAPPLLLANHIITSCRQGNVYRLDLDNPLMIEGDRGAGKTALPRALAAARRMIDYVPDGGAAAEGGYWLQTAASLLRSLSRKGGQR